MLQDFIKAVENNELVNIFGCTALGNSAYRIIKEINISVPIVFIDNSIEKQKNLFCGEKVFGLNQRKSRLDKEYYVIASFPYCDEMEMELKEKGIDSKYIVRPEEISKILMTARRLPHQKLKFAVDLAEHCNLNCRGCDHFAPLAEECITQVNEYESDIKRLSILLGNNVSQIKLEGGEPLLNPHIVRFIEITYKYFPHSAISIYTNGTLLLKMTDSFWEACSKYGVSLVVTKYPIAFDYDMAYKKAEKKNVEMHYYSGGEVVKKLRHHPLDVQGNQNIEENFYNCFLANNCIMLKSGRLFTCTAIPNMRHFNRYFEQNLEVTEDDSIDIYNNVTYQDIMSFLSKPVPACRYCKVADRTDGHEWCVSKKDIGEWT